jgi:hypothetical protein
MKFITSFFFATFCFLFFIYESHGETVIEDRFIWSLAKPDYIAEGDNREQDINDRLSLEELIKFSDIIVVAKVITPRIGVQIGEGASDFSSCTLKIEKVLKGDKNSRKVLLAMPPLVSIGRATFHQWQGPIVTAVGLKGVWFLTKNPHGIPDNAIERVKKEGDYYFANRKEMHLKQDDGLIKKIMEILGNQAKGTKTKS